MTGCSALLCSSRSEKGARLFRFPRDANRKAIWVLNMRRESGWKPTVNSRLCEKHFDPSQFESHRVDQWNKLKQNAVPTLFHYKLIKSSNSLPRPISVK